MIVDLARIFLTRADAQRWTKVKADAIALEFFLGAWQALELAKHPAAASVGAFTAMALPSRGVKELRALVAKADANG